MRAPSAETETPEAPTLGSKVCYLESVMGIPFSHGNSVRVLQNGDEIFPAMLEAVASARDSINFATYVYWTGNIAQEFAAALAAKAREGVTVRVLLDAHGASKMHPKLLSKMQSAGVDARWFRPFRKRFWDFDKRTHRKLLICDKRVAFTGGVGIAKEWEGNARNPDEWRETHFAFWGDCVRFLEGAFWDDWFEVDQDALRDVRLARGAGPDGRGKADAHDVSLQVISSSPATHQSPMERAFVAFCLVAEKRIQISTPYFVLQKEFVELLQERARNGIEIEIMLPGQHIDQRFERWMNQRYVPALLQAGIKVWRFRPTMLHTKLWIIDDELVCVGSPNLNQRSRKKDEEVAVVIANEPLARILAKSYAADRERCAPFTQKELRRRRYLRWLLTRLGEPFKEQF